MRVPTGVSPTQQFAPVASQQSSNSAEGHSPKINAQKGEKSSSTVKEGASSVKEITSNVPLKHSPHPTGEKVSVTTDYYTATTGVIGGVVSSLWGFFDAHKETIQFAVTGVTEAAAAIGGLASEVFAVVVGTNQDALESQIAELEGQPKEVYQRAANALSEGNAEQFNRACKEILSLTEKEITGLGDLNDTLFRCAEEKGFEVNPDLVEAQKRLGYSSFNNVVQIVVEVGAQIYNGQQSMVEVATDIYAAASNPQGVINAAFEGVDALFQTFNEGKLLLSGTNEERVINEINHLLEGALYLRAEVGSPFKEEMNKLETSYMFAYLAVIRGDKEDLAKACQVILEITNKLVKMNTQGEDSLALFNQLKGLNEALGEFAKEKGLSASRVEGQFPGFFEESVGGTIGSLLQGATDLVGLFIESTQERVNASLEEASKLAEAHLPDIIVQQVGVKPEIVSDAVDLEKIFTSLYGYLSHGEYANHAGDLRSTLHFYGVPYIIIDQLLGTLQANLTTALSSENLAIIADRTMQDITKFLGALKQLRDYERDPGFTFNQEELKVFRELENLELTDSQRQELLNKKEQILSDKRSAFVFEKLVPGKGADYTKHYTKVWSDKISGLATKNVNSKKTSGLMEQGIKVMMENVTSWFKHSFYKVLKRVFRTFLPQLIASTGPIQSKVPFIEGFTHAEELKDIAPSVGNIFVWFVVGSALTHANEALDEKNKVNHLDNHVREVGSGLVDLLIDKNSETDGVAKKTVRNVISETVDKLSGALHLSQAMKAISLNLTTWVRNVPPNKLEFDLLDKELKDLSKVKNYVRMAEIHQRKAELLKNDPSLASFLSQMGSAVTFKSSVQLEEQEALNCLKKAYGEKKDPALLAPLKTAYLRVARLFEAESKHSGSLKKELGIYNFGKFFNEVKALGEPIPVEFYEMQGIDLDLDAYEKAAMQGDVTARQRLGELYVKEGNYEKALELYLAASTQNSKESLFELAKFLEDHGDKVYLPNEFKEEYSPQKLYEKAASSGHIEASLAYGRGILEGKGDPQKGVQFLREIAKQGVGEALYLLGRCYEEGIEKGAYQADLYYAQASKLGYKVPPKAPLAPNIEEKSIPKNLGDKGLASGYLKAARSEVKGSDKEFELLRKAANLASPEAYNRLGEYHMNRGDFKAAFNWFAKAPNAEDLRQKAFVKALTDKPPLLSATTREELLELCRDEGICAEPN